MSDTNEQKVKSIKYINIKNKKEDQLDAEILIPTEIVEIKENSNIMEVRALQKVICFLTTAIIVLLSFVIYLFYAHHSNFRGLSEHQKFTCQPLNNVETILFTLIKSPNNTCTDSTNCNALLDKIEKDHEGLKYNFVIGNKGELYIGSGFKCRVNESENVLHIKVLQNNNHSLGGEQDANLCLRITEIIEEGLLCGKISTNFSAFSRTSDNETYHYNVTNNVCSDLSSKTIPSRNFHFHNSEHNGRSLIHQDVKWTFCGHIFSNMKKEQSNKVITLESFNGKSCLPFKPVSRVELDVVMMPHSPCLDNSSTCVQYFEKNHDGLDYNFVFDAYNNMYVGLGFRCKAQGGTDNILKIKQLLTDTYVILEPIFHILYEGLICGKIHKEFTINVNCSKEEIFRSTCEFYEDASTKIITILSTVTLDTSSKFEYLNNQTEHNRDFVSRLSSFKACHTHTQAAQTSTSTFRYEDSSVSFMETTSYPSTTDSTSHHSEDTSTPVSPFPWGSDEDIVISDDYYDY